MHANMILFYGQASEQNSDTDLFEASLSEPHTSESFVESSFYEFKR